MSDILQFDFALQEPALSLAPVFLTLNKKERAKLDVKFRFDGTLINWRGPDALGVTEQSVLLALLSIANQQTFWLSMHPAKESESAKLLPMMSIEGDRVHGGLKVLKISWQRLAAAVGYTSMGGENTALVKAALRRLAETTIWEKRDNKTYQSRVLAWIVGDDELVTVALNQRATNALNGGQFIKISLSERRMLGDDRSKCLHAWLCGCIRSGSTRTFYVDSLQSHVWGDVKVGIALRQRRLRLKDAINNINFLASWQCNFISSKRVEICRLPTCRKCRMPGVSRW